MYHRSLYDIVMETGRSIGVLTREMQGEDELFASALTLRAVEAQLLIMAHTLGNVTPALHTPLMAVTNAVSSVIIVGALLAAGLKGLGAAQLFGFIAVALAAVNIFGGFIVTHRMLSMFKKKPVKK